MTRKQFFAGLLGLGFVSIMPKIETEKPVDFQISHKTVAWWKWKMLREREVWKRKESKEEKIQRLVEQDMIIMNEMYKKAFDIWMDKEEAILKTREGFMLYKLGYPTDTIYKLLKHKI